MAPHAPGSSSPEALIARLAAARSTLGAEAQILRRQLDVPSRVRQSLFSKPLVWLGGSTAAGVLLSLLFRRRPKVAETAKKKRGIFGFLLGSAFSLARPALQSWAMKELRNRLAPAPHDPWRKD